MLIKPFADQGNFTAIHNYVFDVIMPSLPPNAWKVLCFVIRKTHGWQKRSDHLSYSQIVEGTGIKSPATISAALKELVSRKFVLTTSSDKWEATSYSLNTTLKIEATSKNEVGASTSKNEAVSTTEIEVAPTSKNEDTERNLKTKKERGGGSAETTPPTTAHNVSDDEFLASLKADPAYAGLDIDVELGKLRDWCAEKNKTPSRRLFRKWLDNADRPLTLVGKSPPRPTSRRAELKVSGNGIDDLMRSQGAVGRAQ
jgi:phage replication O-like protein O